MELRKWVEELVIYSFDDLSKDEAEELKASNIGGWTIDIEGARGINEIGPALKKYVNLRRLTFCTHGFSGGVFFDEGSVISVNLKKIAVPRDLYKDEGQLLFMGCETARNKDGEDFLIAAGRHFFAGKGGVVGGATVSTMGWSSGTVLPYVTLHWNALPEIGKLVLFRLDATGNVVARKIAR
jgi:hypothetical protein